MENLDRQVSVILFADIVGYTTMMQTHEENALKKLQHYDRTIKLETQKAGGEIIKNYGDGSLILFNSAIKAVQCAINVQQGLNRDLEVPLRIGIHIGEIVRRDRDIFGNGINIASRIESMGVANSILISSDVFIQIKNHPKIKVQKLGSFEFKNVDRKIELFAIDNGKLVIPKLSEMKGKGTLRTKWNAWLIMIPIVLIVSLIFFYNQVTKTKGTQEQILTSNQEALDYYLKGEFYHKKDNASDIDTAIMYYEKAILNDSKFAMAYNNLGSAYMRKYLSFDPNTTWEEEAYAAAGKALLLDPDMANPHVIKGQFFWSQSYNFAHEEAINEFEKAILKNPELSQAYEQLSLVQLHIGLSDKALENAAKSIALNPDNLRARRFVAEALLFKGDYSSSLVEFEKLPKGFAPHPTQSLLALNYIYLNRLEEAAGILDDILIENPKSSIANSVYAIILASQGKVEEVEQKSSLAIENSDKFIHVHHLYYHLGIAASLLDRKEDAVEWLRKAVETGFPNYPLIKSDPLLVNLKGQTKFEALLDDLESKWEYFKQL